VSIELELLQRLQGIVGLPQLDDVDGAVWLRADAEAVAHAKFFIDMGVDPEETVVLMRVTARHFRILPGALTVFATAPASCSCPRRLILKIKLRHAFSLKTVGSL
jgi:hypothetical protein